MIGKLRGLVDSSEEDSLLLDVNGVGYVLFCSGKTLAQMPEKGDFAEVFVETHVREDHIHLYGFASAQERTAFKTLQKVSGIGAKLALAILSHLTPQMLATALVAQDKAAFTAIPGVGPKMAARLLTELKDKAITSAMPMQIAPNFDEDSKASNNNNAMSEALSALTHLGYNRSDAFTALQKIFSRNANTPLETAIREGLKELSA
jgi:Holliday junction DNA helicase RuvA